MKLPSKTYRTPRQEQAYRRSFQGRYFKALQKHSFLLFGLPFIASLTLGAYGLSYFTAVRYETHDERVQAMQEDEMLQVSNQKRKVNMKDEYYRLMQLDTDDWEQKRVPRLEGESQNVWGTPAK